VKNSPTVSMKFDSAVRISLDEGLNALGESVRQTIYYHVEKGYQVKPESVPERIETFHEALEGLLDEGSKVVEKLIAQKLYGALGLNFTEQEHWTIIDYLSDAKSKKKNRT